VGYCQTGLYDEGRHYDLLMPGPPAMLQVARDKTERSGIAIHYVHADARAYSLDRLYQLIFIANNSLSHLLRREDVEAGFRLRAAASGSGWPIYS